MWLLHTGPDHVRRRPPGGGQSNVRRGNPRVHERKPLPLRRVSEHRRRDPRGRGSMNGRFEYIRADDVATAVALVSADPAAHYLAGGTTQVDLFKDGVLNPGRLVDITRLPLRGI